MQTVLKLHKRDSCLRAEERQERRGNKRLEEEREEVQLNVKET